MSSLRKNALFRILISELVAELLDVNVEASRIRLSACTTKTPKYGAIARRHSTKAPQNSSAKLRIGHTVNSVATKKMHSSEF